MRSFIENMPKAELHLHIEGSLEPELMFELAKRNKVKLPYNSVEEVRAAYQFNNLQDFLDIYYAGTKVLVTEQDFYDLTWAYFVKANEQHIIHAEIFFDPQSHTSRGIAFETVVKGIRQAMRKAEEQFGITCHLILSFLRHLSEEDAIATLQQGLAMQDEFIAVGLDSSEMGNPPEKFQYVFEMAAEHGFLKVAHAGEEGPAQYVWDSLSLLQIDRLDHGNRAMEHDKLLSDLAYREIGLTLCPLSNLKLKVVDDLANHPVKEMLDLGIKATINSDDPAYFGGYINENFIAVSEALELTKEEIYTLAFNSFEVSFADENRKREMQVQLDQYFSDFQ
jgi:adenosine deaminase